MKNSDLSELVMKKVVRYEQKRITWWLRSFYIVLAILLALLGLFVWISWQLLDEGHSWDLLSLFEQDAEIIAEFWQDTLSIFLQELPVEALVAALFVIIGIVVVFVITRKRRKIIAFKRTQLAKKIMMSKNKDA